MKAIYRHWIPIVIWLVAVTVSWYYAYSTRYWTVYDGARDYALFDYYRTHSMWHPMNDVLGLQNTAIFSTFIPAMVQTLLHIPSDIFFRSWIAIGCSIVPVLVYFFTRKFVGRYYAIFGSVFVMGWVSFYQGGSYARSNFAMIMYLCILLILFSMSKSDKWRYAELGVLAAALPLAHYGAAIVLLFTSMIVLCVILVKGRERHIVKGLTVILVALVVSTVVWHGLINKVVWRNISVMIDDAQEMVVRGINNIDRVGGNITNAPDPSIDNPLVAISSRDKITQAAFGILHPDGSSAFTLNWGLLIFAWLTVVLMFLGAWITIKGNYPLIYKSFVIMAFISLAITVLLPQLSRGYGIEKVYYQAIMVTSPCVIMGGKSVANKVHCPAWIILCSVIIPYVILMWKFGVIASILG